MSISPDELEKIARLACLDTEHSAQLERDLNAIMELVEQLRQVDVKQIEPLSHPLELNQPVRIDEVTEANCVAELETIAPLFEEQYYLVPKVLESDN